MAIFQIYINNMIIYDQQIKEIIMEYEVNVGDELVYKSFKDGEFTDQYMRVKSIENNNLNIEGIENLDIVHSILVKDGYYSMESSECIFTKKFLEDDPVVTIVVSVKTSMQGSDVTDTLDIQMSEYITIDTDDIEMLAKEVVFNNIEWGYDVVGMD